MSKLTPAPLRQRVKVYLTPRIGDLLFYEHFIVERSEHPAYGTAYPGDEFPDHELVFVSPVEDAERANLFRYYYAASRAQEDNYNWVIGQGEEVNRYYLVRRSLYYARSAAEAAAATPVVTGEFTHPVVATADPRFAKYGFADDTVIEAPEELKSLYVVVKRRYLKPVTIEIQYEENYAFRVQSTYTLVPASYTNSNLPADTNGAVYELQPVNTFHSRQVKREVLPESDGWTLANYSKVQGVRTNIPNLPRELISVNVVWNSQYSIGTQDYLFYKWQSGDSLSLSKSADDAASSSASITPEIQLKFRDIEASNLPATEYEIFIAGDATEAAVLARLTALAGSTVLSWPVFRPESVTISTTGQSINVRSNVGISLEGTWNSTDGLTSQGYDRGTSDDFSVNLTVGSVQLPACIHGTITLTGDTTRSQLVAATAFMQMYNSLVGTNSATKTKSGTAYGTVTPTSIAAVSGATTIPTSGLYALEIRPGVNYLGYTRVVATVLNATTLA